MNTKLFTVFESIKEVEISVFLSFMKHLQRHLQFLTRLSKTRGAEARRILLSKCSLSELEALVEICFNIVQGNLKLTPARRKKLASVAPLIRQVARKKCSKTARDLLVQRGGGIPFAALLTPVIAYIIKNLVE